MEKDNLQTIHRPLSAFYYGSIAVILLSLTIGAYYFSYHFLQNEKKRAEISSLQVKDSLNTEYRYIVEEFFTNSYDSISIRVNNALEKFGTLDHELYLFNTDGVCVYANNKSGNGSCKTALIEKSNFLSYESTLRLGTNVIGKMKVNVEDRFQFYTGNLSSLAFNNFSVIFLIVAILWGGWVFFSKHFILIPYYKKMLMMEKDKASFNTIRQIIHDTKGEIASLDLLSYEIEDMQKAEEMRSTLDKIRKAFDNLHQVKDSILTTKKDSLHEVFSLMADIESHQRIKYKNLSNVEIEFKTNRLTNEKLTLDSVLFERVISNLIENSISAPCNKEIRKITVATGVADQEIVFQITDNGEGISQDYLPRIFEKGFTTKANGTGQGLAFVKEQIESWKGSVNVQSEPGMQTIVTLSIPLAKKPMFVILDDDKYLLQRYQKMLQKFGNETAGYSSPQDLYDNVKHFNSESIFLLDYDLGGSEVGTDVARKLSNLGMRNLYLHTGNPMTDEMDFPFLKGILTKGNFIETMKILKT